MNVYRKSRHLPVSSPSVPVEQSNHQLICHTQQEYIQVGSVYRSARFLLSVCGCRLDVSIKVRCHSLPVRLECDKKKTRLWVCLCVEGGCSGGLWELRGTVCCDEWDLYNRLAFHQGQGLVWCCCASLQSSAADGALMWPTATETVTRGLF